MMLWAIETLFLCNFSATETRYFVPYSFGLDEFLFISLEIELGDQLSSFAI